MESSRTDSHVCGKREEGVEWTKGMGSDMNGAGLPLATIKADQRYEGSPQMR